MKVVKSILFILCSLVMEGALIFVPETSGNVSIAYLSVIGIYLGLDIANMITKTASMDKGSFESLNVYKYVISLISLIVLIVTSIILKDKGTVSTALSSFITCIMIVFGCIIGGLEGNKIATNVGKDEC